MSKKDEALKLALEAMTYADACLKKQLTTKDKHQYAQDLLLEAGTAIREALAEQPAQQEPVKHELQCICGCSWEIDTDGNEELVSSPPAQQEPVNLRRGDLLRCIETDELCTVWATSPTGNTLIKWSANNFGNYTAEQIGELFWLEPEHQEPIVALELLSRCENEMRYAGWDKFESDNTARNGVYEQVKRFLEKNT